VALSDEAPIDPSCLNCIWLEMCAFWLGDGGSQKTICNDQAGICMPPPAPEYPLAKNDTVTHVMDRSKV
jgi:hypothetical protein